MEYLGEGGRIKREMERKSFPSVVTFVMTAVNNNLENLYARHGSEY